MTGLEPAPARPSQQELTDRNIRTGLRVMGAVVGMIILSFASVPLYRLFCQVTGFGGTPMINPNAVSSGVLDQQITIRFNADTAQGMPWQFRAEQSSLTLAIGQTGLVSFEARNNSRAPVQGTAIYNVLPQAAGKYFHKTQCFCFGVQTLAPGQDVHMPVAFFVDPKIAEDPDLRDLRTITLSYTFFKADTPELERALEAYYNKPQATGAGGAVPVASGPVPATEPQDKTVQDPIERPASHGLDTRI